MTTPEILCASKVRAANDAHERHGHPEKADQVVCNIAGGCPGCAKESAEGMTEQESYDEMTAWMEKHIYRERADD